MIRFALRDFDRPEFSTKISTGFVEIFDGFRDDNLTSEAKTTPLFLLLGEFGETPVEVDHDLANLVLAAYRLSERGETPGSTSLANRSQ